jgi:hypothetical protein
MDLWLYDRGFDSMDEYLDYVNDMAWHMAFHVGTFPQNMGNCIRIPFPDSFSQGN